MLQRGKKAMFTRFYTCWRFGVCCKYSLTKRSLPMLDVGISKDGSRLAASLGSNACAMTLDNRSSLDPSGLDIFPGCPQIKGAGANNLVLPGSPAYIWKQGLSGQTCITQMIILMNHPAASGSWNSRTEEEIPTTCLRHPQTLVKTTTVISYTWLCHHQQVGEPAAATWVMSEQL